MHPNVRSIGRVMSGFGSISSSLITIQNALNLSTIAAAGANSDLAQAQADVKQAQREYTAAVKEFGEDSPEAADALDKLNVSMARQQEIMDRMKQEDINKYFTLASGIGMIGSSVLNTATTIGQSGFMGKLDGLGKALGKLGGGSAARALGGMAAIGGGAALLATGGIDALMGKSGELEDKLKAIGGIGLIGVGIALEFPAIAKIALIGTAIATATVAIILFREEIASAFGAMAEFLAPAGEAIGKFFLEDLPAWGGEALDWLRDVFATGFIQAWEFIKSSAETVWAGLQSAFLSFWNGMINVINAAGSAIVSGVNSVASAVVGAINFLIDAYNSAAAALGIGGLQRVGFSPLAFAPIPTISAATGFNGRLHEDTMFLAHRGEQVDITPASRVGHGGGGATYIVVQNIGGSIRSDRELWRFADQGHELELRRRGFNAPL